MKFSKLLSYTFYHSSRQDQKRLGILFSLYAIKVAIAIFSCKETSDFHRGYNKTLFCYFNTNLNRNIISRIYIQFLFKCETK